MSIELIIDSFAGGGGTSTGIELATGRIVDYAINHDPDAILMHQTNHPRTTHLQESVWDVDPEEVCQGRPVGLFWASPDCKHFSKAKGGKPVDKRIRGLAWVVLRWAGTVSPRVVILENVEEFQTWGPVDSDNQPIKDRAGETFRAFVLALTSGIPADHPAFPEMCEMLGITGSSDLARKMVEGLGYTVEWRELVAADYGAPTTRKRFFLIARRDGQPITWPEPIHAPSDSADVREGRKLPWRSAAEIIDWSLPCPSIFASRAEIKEQYGLNAQRPLRPNTMRRVARGLDKFVLKAAKPFIVPWTVTNTSNSTGHPVAEPMDTIRTGGGGGQMFVTPALIQYHTEQTEKVRGQAVSDPVMTIDAANRYGLAAATLVKYYSGDGAQSAAQPLHTSTTKDREGLVVAHMVKMKGDNLGGSVTEPVQTVTAGGGHHGVVVTTIVKVTPGVDLHHWPEIRELLNEHCGYTLAEDEIILFNIGGVFYFIADIGLRMLTPRELYRANGFPDDYIIDYDYLGNTYKKTAQVARCGNAVPPPFAAALVRANFPEWCEGKNIRTMAEFEKAVAS